MAVLSSTARTLIALKKLEAGTSHAPTAEIARACISDIHLARLFFDLNDTTDNLPKAKDASAHYASSAQDPTLAAQFDRILNGLENTLSRVNMKQDELLKQLEKTQKEVREIHLKILKQLDEATVKNFDVESLRTSSTIHKQYQDIKNLLDPLRTAGKNWVQEKIKVEEQIEGVFGDIIDRLPAKDSKKFPQRTYATHRQPGGKSGG
jgi:chromosome segregation ATPase